MAPTDYIQSKVDKLDSKFCEHLGEWTSNLRHFNLHLALGEK